MIASWPLSGRFADPDPAAGACMQAASAWCC